MDCLLPGFQGPPQLPSHRNSHPPLQPQNGDQERCPRRQHREKQQTFATGRLPLPAAVGLPARLLSTPHCISTLCPLGFRGTGVDEKWCHKRRRHVVAELEKCSAGYHALTRFAGVTPSLPNDHAKQSRKLRDRTGAQRREQAIGSNQIYNQGRSTQAARAAAPEAAGHATGRSMGQGSGRESQARHRGRGWVRALGPQATACSAGPPIITAASQTSRRPARRPQRL